MKNEKIKWINGLKGLCCLLIFIHHFALNFYSSTYYGIEVGQKTKSGIDVLMASEPYGVFLNGNLYICIFITITGFLFAYKNFANLYRNKDPLSIIFQRYLKLFLLCFFGSVFYYLVNIAFSIFYNSGFDIKNELNIITYINNLFFFQWFDKTKSVLTYFWPMKYFFLGSILAYYSSLLSNKNRWYMPIIYLLFGIGMKYIDCYFSAILFGVSLADVYYFDRFGFFNKNKTLKTVQYLFGFLILLFGIFLGGYPSYVTPTNNFYVFIKNTIEGDGYYYRCVASFFIMLGCVVLPKLYILPSKIFQFFGNISIEIFLTHSLVINLFSRPLFVLLNNKIQSYSVSCLIVFIFSFVTLMFVSIIYKKIISTNVNKILTKINIIFSL